MSNEKPAEAAKPEGGDQKPAETPPEKPKTEEQIREEVRANAIKDVLGPKEEEKPAEKPPEEPGKKEGAKPAEKPEGEQKPEEKPAEKKPEGDEQLEKSWSAIVRRDRELQVERKAFKDQQKELEELRALKHEIDEDPIGFAYKKIGPDGLTRLTARVTAGGKPSAEEEAEILRKKSSKQEEDLKAKDEEEKQRKIQERVNEYHSDLKAAAKPEAFPLVNLRNAVDDALEVAILHAQESNGDVLTHEQALQIMEDHLVEEIKRDHKAGNLTVKELADPAVKKILGLEEKPEEKKPEEKPKTPGREKGHPPPVKAPEQMSRDEWRNHCLKEEGLI